MTRDIRRRLQKLELQVPRQPTEQRKLGNFTSGFLRYAVAYYLGDPAPDGGPEEVGRGRLCAGTWISRLVHFEMACEANDADLNEKMIWPKQTISEIWRELGP